MYTFPAVVYCTGSLEGTVMANAIKLSVEQDKSTLFPLAVIIAAFALTNSGSLQAVMLMTSSDRDGALKVFDTYGGCQVRQRLVTFATQCLDPQESMTRSQFLERYGALINPLVFESLQQCLPKLAVYSPYVRRCVR